MIRNLIILCFIISLLSCNESKTIDGYYYSSRNYDIYKFDDTNSKIFHLRDSTIEPFNYKVWDEDLLELNGINYHFKKHKDSLEFFDFEKEKLTLTRFSHKTLSIENLNSTSWIMDVNRTNREFSTKFTEQQIISINDNLNAYYINNNDTLLGSKFYYSGKLFNEFTSFDEANFSFIIPIKLSKKDIDILLMNGISNKIYKLEKIEN